MLKNGQVELLLKIRRIMMLIIITLDRRISEIQRSEEVIYYK